MSTKALLINFRRSKEATYVPETPRGRALFTIDWFLNGKPVLRNHDNRQLSIHNGCHC